MTEYLFNGLDDSDQTPPPYESISNGVADAKPRPKNIILFGETGAGKSALINLVAGAEVAITSADATACTLQSTKYSLTFPGESPDAGMSIHIFDTIGLEEPDPGLPSLTSLLGAIESAHALTTALHAAGGVDLLLFCIRAGRITIAMQRHYRLFFEVLCQKRVPLAVVVTHLENEAVMEDWWTRNEAAFVAYGIRSVAHTCVTAAPADLEAFASKRAASRIAVVRMLHGILCRHRPTYVQEDRRSWFVSLMEMLVTFFTRGGVSFERRALVRRLETRCSFPREDAQRLAEMILRRRR